MNGPMAGMTSMAWEAAVSGVVSKITPQAGNAV